MSCFSLSLMTVNEESLLFGLLFGQEKQSEDVNLDSGKMWAVLFFFFSIIILLLTNILKIDLP